MVSVFILTGDIKTRVYLFIWHWSESFFVFVYGIDWSYGIYIILVHCRTFHSSSVVLSLFDLKAPHYPTQYLKYMR